MLVIATINLTDKTSIGPHGNGLRHSDKMRIVEKLNPFTASLPLTPLDGGVLLP